MSRPLKLLHSLTVILLGLSALTGVSILCISLVISSFVLGEAPRSTAWMYGPVVALLFLVAVCGWAIATRLRWHWLLLAALPITVCFAFLANDDSTPPPPADLGPRVGTEDPGYQTIMWLAEESPYSRLGEPGAPDPATANLRLPEEPEKWSEHIAANREAIVAARKANTIGRDWIAGLAQHPPAGVFPLASLKVHLSFTAIRATTELDLAWAYALALDGARDKGIRVAVPVLQAGGNLQRTGTTLLNVMIGEVIVKRSYRTLEAILRLGPVADETNALILAALRNVPPPRQILRNGILGEGDFVRLALDALRHKNFGKTLSSPQDRWINLGLAIGGRWVFNPNRTERRINAILAQIDARAETRDLKAFENWLPDWEGESQLKNPVGRMLAGIIIPASNKAVKEVWATEDRRLALLEKCQSPARFEPATADTAP